MIKQFLRLEWKQFTRSKAFKQSLAIKIVMIFFALYFLVSFAALGFGTYFIIEEGFPGQDPFQIVNRYILYWLTLEIAYRFLLQKLPVMNIKPLMILPIRKSTAIHYLLGKSTFSFFNILPLFFYLPFTGVLLFKNYAVIPVLLWLVSMIFFELSINYLNFLINKISAVFYSILGLLILAIALQYFGIYDLTLASEFVFYRFFETPYAVLIPILLAVFLYRKNYQFLLNGFYLDEKVKEKKEEAKEIELSWLDRFGEVAIFLKNDIRMIWRNKRPKQVVLTSVLFLFYGLIFYTQDMYVNSSWALVFASLFVTGGFLMTFGQLVPAWDSEYYPLLMSQNIPYKKYLESKWYLMVVVTAISFVLCTPYLYFGWKVFTMIAACAIYNIGMNSFVTLWGGALNRKPVELNVKAKAFSNTQGFNMTQMLIAIPKMVLPILLFLLPNWLGGFWVGIAVVSLTGLSGIVFKDFFLKQIEGIYQSGKYKTIEAFAEKN